MFYSDEMFLVDCFLLRVLLEENLCSFDLVDQPFKPASTHAKNASHTTPVVLCSSSTAAGDTR